MNQRIDKRQTCQTEVAEDVPPADLAPVLEQLFLSIVRPLVERKSLVHVDARRVATAIFVIISVAPEDLPNVRGVGGRTEGSLRTILLGLGLRHKRSLLLEIRAITKRNLRPLTLDIAHLRA